MVKETPGTVVWK